jgi:hypothetical protein
LAQPLAYAQRGQNQLGSAVRINNQILVVQFLPVSAGPGDPRPMLTFNGSAPTGPTEFGVRWQSSYKRNVQTIDSQTAKVNTGAGTNYTYTSLDATTNYYLPPA